MTVYLVGAGPGDPGLLTVRGAEVLARAEVVVHDRLAEPSLLDLVPTGSERFDVGKVPGGPVDQDGINRLLIDRGRRGQRVVRLKGGDPFVFGRGGEEALALAAAGVPFEVVPGVTAAVAVPAYAGVPVTHRGVSTSFTVVTGHSRAAVDQETDWEALAKAGGTIVVLMGVAHRSEIAARLVAGGLAPSTPVVAIRWGTRPEQATVRTSLAELGRAALTPPATIVIGGVAGIDVGWYERLPLFGRRVVVTRPRGQAAALSNRLRALGARPIEIPAVAIGPPADGGAGLAAAAEVLRSGRYEWVVFTSVNGVDRFFEHLRDARDFAGSSGGRPARIAAIGTGTADALARHGLVADLVPERFVAEALVEQFADPPASGGRVLLPRAATAREVLPEGLRRRGWSVDVVEAYRTRPARLEPGALDEAKAADAICFTASSTVTSYLDAAGLDAVPPVVVCIGPVTAATARKAGLTVSAEAGDHTIDGVVRTLVSALT
jgi:uroporphyrinogen III methyltransferase / synthase